MSPAKLAAQVGHVCKELGRQYPISDHEKDVIIVLKASETKIKKYIDEDFQKYQYKHAQVDIGLTEVQDGSVTAIGWIESYDPLIDGQKMLTSRRIKKNIQVSFDDMSRDEIRNKVHETLRKVRREQGFES